MTRLAPPPPKPATRPPSPPERLVTEDELLRMPKGQGKRELIYGRVVEMPPPGFGHGSSQMLFGSTLLAFVRPRKLGLIVAECGFILERDPDLVRLPDVAFVRADRTPAADREDLHYDGPPDLAVEVLSPDDRPGAMAEKVAQYLSHGTPLVWVLSRRRRELTAHRPGHPPRVYRDGEIVDGGDVLPGFTCTVADLID